jgi:hypothetical protein
MHAIPDPHTWVSADDWTLIAQAFARIGMTAPPLGRCVVSLDPPPVPGPPPRPSSRATA